MTSYISHKIAHENIISSKADTSSIRRQNDILYQ